MPAAGHSGLLILLACSSPATAANSVVVRQPSRVQAAALGSGVSMIALVGPFVSGQPLVVATAAPLRAPVALPLSAGHAVAGSALSARPNGMFDGGQAASRARPAGAALGAAMAPPAVGSAAGAEQDPPDQAARLNGMFDGYLGARRIRLSSDDGVLAEDRQAAREYLEVLARPPRLGSIPDSGSVTRLRPLFQLSTRHVARLDPAHPGMLLMSPEGRMPRFGAHRYADLTNGSRFSTTDARGRIRHFVAVRGVREGYTVRADMKTGGLATDRYVSDELLFEVTYDAAGNRTARRFVGPMIESASEDIRVKPGQFVFEDGRVFSPAPDRLAIGGTLIDGFKDGAILTRHVMAELDVDPVTGIPTVRGGAPAWHSMAPGGLDVKNGLVASTGRGKEVVVLLRLNAPDGLGGRVFAGHSVIRTSFPSYEAFLAYDSAHLLEDLLHPEAFGRQPRAYPAKAGVLLSGDALRELFAGDPRVVKSGFGNGAKPARVTMDAAGRVFLRESFGARPVRIGRVGRRGRRRFPLKPGESKWLFLGHQLRYYKDGLNFRDYNAFAWLTDEGMERVERVRAALLSGDDKQESAAASLIADLTRHNYPMGLEVMENGELHFSFGQGDKNTGTARLDVMALLGEMADGSPQVKAGLVYGLTQKKGSNAAQ